MKSLLSLRKQTEFYPDFWSLFYHTSFFSRRGLLKYVKAYAPQLNGRMMDFGCGSKPYQQFFSVSDYVGVDIEVSGHDHRESKVDVFYDGKTLPFPDASFDSFFSSEVFEHVFNLEPILQEIHRVVKPGGKMLVTIPFATHEHEAPYDFARYTSFGITELLTKNGFQIMKVQKTNHYLEMIFQLIVWYNTTLIIRKNKLLTFLQLLLLVAPFNVMGVLLPKLLPKRYTHYNNLVVLAQRN